jgi:two-component system chemotaxis response regulator CheB
MTRKIKVLVVDDSALVRQCLTQVLQTDPEIEVIGTASDPYIAVERIGNDPPDVITLDVEMPRMDGLTFLKRLMSQHPIPVVICSTLTEQGSETALLALQRGAVDIITKPKLGSSEFFRESCSMICDTVKSATHAQMRRHAALANAVQPAPKLTADAVLAPAGSRAMLQTSERVVMIGASTGGTEAVREFLEALPVDAPGAVIV